MTTIPCRRPSVTMEPHTKTFASGATGTYHLARCHVPGCDWSYDAAVVTDAQDQAKRHRASHRDAVPRIETKTLDSGRTADQCQHCGWVTPTGVTTSVDRAAQVAYHLSTHHGLVTC